VVWSTLRGVLVVYLPLVVGMIATALGVVSFDKGQSVFLMGLAWLFVASTVVTALAWLWKYREMTGWFFRRKTWSLSRDMLAFISGPARDHLNRFLYPQQGQEMYIVRGWYSSRFNRRLRSVLEEGAERNCIREESWPSFLNPQSIEQMEVNAETLRSLALLYRRY
jgi:hypothetical protein